MTSTRAEGTRPKVVESGIVADYTGADIKARDVGSYNSVHGNVTVTHNHHQEASGVSTKIAQWLRIPSINYKSIQEETRVMRTPNTIRWFFESKEYILWVEDGAGGNRNLQCIGMPGAGKTVLASAIIEDLERRFKEDPSSEPGVVLYIYFKHDRQAIQTTPAVLANLLSQLIQMKEPPSGSALSFYQEYQAHPDVAPGQDKITTTLESEISSNTTTYIVIDALDEFAPEDFSSALALVKELERLDVKLLITSRYGFSFLRDHSLRVEVSASEADVTLYIEERISSSSRLRKRSAELKSEIVVKVTAKSQGMFLITRFIMDWLCGLLTANAVKNGLENLPTGAEAMYELTMGRVKDQLDDCRELGMSALSWVLLAKRRLSMKELQHVVAFELQGGKAMVDDDDLYEMEDIISACMGLIVCVDDEVQFVHFSTQEFLHEYCDKYFPDAKLRAMEICLRFLIIVAPRIPDDIRHANDPYKKATEYFRPFPFTDYASSHWGLHASDVDSHERLNVKLIDSFFSLPLSPYLASYNFPYPHIKQTEKMSTVTYKILLFSIFGLCSLLKRCTENTNDRCQGCTKVDLNVRDKQGWTPLFLATAHNRSAAAQILLNAGADATVVGGIGETCLHEAASRGLIEIITMLLRHGAVIDARDNRGESAIFYAVRGSKLEVFELLREKGADIRISNEKGQTLLHQAAYRGRSDIVTILLEKGMDINSLDGDGCTPIWMAVDWREGEMVRWLIEKGADISIPDKSGQTLLHRAAYRGMSDIATILLEKGMEINSVDGDGCTPVWISVNRQEGEMVRFLVERGADISIASKSGQTLLHRAAYCGLLDIATVLLEKGMEINSLDDDGRSPIWMAVDGRESEMVRLLIEKGADISIPNKSGQTLLHGAAYQGLSDIVTILLDEHGFDVNRQDAEGRTATFSAAEGGHPDVMQLLLAQGADASLTNRNGETLLHAAARKNRSDAVIALLHDTHLDVDAKDNSGRTALLTAMEHESYSAAAVLIENGASTTDFAKQNFSSENLNDLLRWVAYCGCTRALELLIAMDADLDGTNGNGDGIVAYSAAGHALEALKLLLSQGIVDIDKPNEDQQAPISHAIRGWTWKFNPRYSVPDSERAAVVRILLERGADIHRVDEYGKTPLSRARECEWPEIRELVEQHAICLQQSKAHSKDEGAVVDGVVGDGQREEPASHRGHDQDDARNSPGDDVKAELLDDDAQEAKDADWEPVEEIGEITEGDPHDGGRRMADGENGLALEDAELGKKESEGVERVGSRTEEGLQETSETVYSEEKQREASIALQDASERRERRFGFEKLLNLIVIVIIALLAYIVGRSSEKT